VGVDQPHARQCTLRAVRWLQRLWAAIDDRVYHTMLGTWLRAARSALFGDMPVLAGGCALFAILATVPTLASIVSIYGLAANPQAIEGHLRGLETVMPAAVVDFVIEQLGRQAQRSSGELVGAIITSFVLALYSARGAASALMDAFNRVYRVRERRSTWRRIVTSIVLAGTTLVGLLVLATLLVALPPLLEILHVPGDDAALANVLRWPILFVAVFFAQMMLHWLAPSPRPIKVRSLWPGALIGTALWMIVSFGLSLWVDRVANYQAFYGAFASVIVVLLWFYVSVIAILIGGFINAELERDAGAPEPSASMM
jgi:membrane protein